MKEECSMDISLIAGIMVPFVGTTLGSAMVFFMRKQINKRLEKLLLGFAIQILCLRLGNFFPMALHKKLCRVSRLLRFQRRRQTLQYLLHELCADAALYKLRP